MRKFRFVSSKKKQKETAQTVARKLLLEQCAWREVLEACIEESKDRSEREGKGVFAGARVFSRVATRGLPTPSNLRTLSSRGLLIKTNSARGGKRAYYKIPDRQGTEPALKEKSP